MNSPTTPSWKRRRLGQRLGRYVLGPSIGAGGAAAVYLARLDGPHGFERLLAIKIVHEHLLEDKDFMAMFLDEANLAVRLSHPNIVHTYELGHQDELLFLAMEYLRGRPLSLVYQRAFEHAAPLEYELISWLGARSADALNYAHELKDEQGQPLQIVHRDISPDNLFVTYDGEIKVIDFGIARAEGRLAQTDVGSVKGKFRYMSPEYALGRSFDHTLDLFALGATLYEAALGRAAFEGADALQTVERLVLGDVLDPAGIRPDFPPELARILSRAMNSSRTLRYESGSELATDLDRHARLTATEARARLAARMHSLFAQEIANEGAILAELRGLRPALIQQEATALHHELLARAPEPARPRWQVAAVLLAASTTVAVPLWLFRSVVAPSTEATRNAGAGAASPARLEASPLPAANPSALATTAPNVASSSPLAAAASQAPPAPEPARRSASAPRRASAIPGGSAPPASPPPRAPTPTPETKREPGGVIRANPFASDP